MKEKFSVPTVSILLERKNPESGEKELLLSLRWKPEYDPKYTDTWEIPGGRIREFENVEETLRREAEEEIGVKVTGIKSKSEKHESKGDSSLAFEPFCGIQFLDGNHPYIGFAFLTEVEGKPEPCEEVKEVKFFSLEELKELLENDRIYTYNKGAVKKYIEKRS